MRQVDYFKRVASTTLFPLADSQRGAIHEVIGLCDDGYMIRFHVFAPDWWFIKLQHVANGRTLVVHWKPKEYSITEGRKNIKREEFPNESAVYGIKK